MKLYLLGSFFQGSSCPVSSLCVTPLPPPSGAAASPLQCLPLADSCLALGAGACRAAIRAITQLLDEETAAAAATTAGPSCSSPLPLPMSSSATAVAATGDCGGADGGGGGGVGALGLAAAGGRVIYAQTDSVFVHFPRYVRTWGYGITRVF